MCWRIFVTPSPLPPLPQAGEGSSTLNHAKSLRTNQTEAEQRLWYHLRAHRFMGLKFKRQKPMGRYVVDFVCMERRLIIELDGGQHAERASYDKIRDEWLRTQGYTVLRFWNNDVMQQLENVLEQIRSTLSPTPLPQAGEGNEVSKFDDAPQHESPLPPAGEGQGEGAAP